MCGICSKLGVNIHTSNTDQMSYSDPNSFSLDPYAGGTYRTKPILDQAGIINQIDSGRSLNVNGGVITYTFLDLDHLTGIYNNKNFGFTAAYGLSPFTEAQRTAAREAVGLWDDLISLSFKESNGLGSDIQFSNSLDPAQAYAYYPTKQGWRFQSDVFVADPEYNVTNKWFSNGGYGDTTLIHELGHAIGLSHPGAYNGAAATTYAGMAEYAQDSLQYSIMSYWSAGQTGAVLRNWLTGQANYAQTPMVHDILTIQAKYGADTTTRATNTTYGFNSTAGKSVYDFTTNKFPVLTIYDAGGNDTLDASGFTAGVFIDLHEGAFSSVSAAVPTLAEVNAGRVALGLELGISLAPTTQATLDAGIALRLPLIQSKILADTGVSGVTATQYDNLAIAYGTIIENAVGGTSRDVLWGNQVANRLDGRAGDDVLNGFEGADTLVGGSGNDTFQFSNLNDLGNTITDFTAGDKIDVSKFDTNAALAGDQAFAFIGSAAFGNVAGQLRYAGGVVEGDVDGNGIADFSIIITGNAPLSATDFIF